MPRKSPLSILRSLIKQIINLICKGFGLPSISELEHQIYAQSFHLKRIDAQQKALYRVISKIRASLDLETIFRTTTQETCKLLRVERVAVYKFNDDWGGEFVSDFEFSEGGWDDSENLGRNIVWNDSYLQEHQGGRYRQNETLAVSDVYTANLTPCHLEILEQFHIRAYATSPIFIGNQLWGLLAAYQHSQPHTWEKLEILFLSQVATQLGFAVKQAELLAQAQQKAEEFQIANQQQDILFSLVAEIRDSLNLDTLFKTTVREVRKALQADRVGIFQFDPESGHIFGEFVAENVLPAYDSAIGIKVRDRCFAEHYATDYQKGRIQVLEDIYLADMQNCHLHVLEELQIKAQIIVPLMKGRSLWGLLCVHQCSHARQWSATEVQFIKQLAAQFNVALEHSELLERFRTQAHQLTESNNALERANAQLEELSKLDGLTKIANRRCFDEVLEQEWIRLRRTEGHLALILFDIDHFKDYNDHYGHLSGDDCLIQVARAAQVVLRRPTDVLARYGGEEFAVILPNTDEAGAIRVAELIQNAIQALQIPQAGQRRNQPFVTVSLGISSQVPVANNSPQDLIEAADQALYKAKSQGRNQWICASEIQAIQER